MKNKKVLRVFEGFAGYGGGHFALDRLKEKYPNFEFEIIGYSEIDKYACELYDLNQAMMDKTIDRSKDSAED